MNALTSTLCSMFCCCFCFTFCEHQKKTKKSSDRQTDELASKRLQASQIVIKEEQDLSQHHFNQMEQSGWRDPEEISTTVKKSSAGERFKKRGRTQDFKSEAPSSFILEKHHSDLSIDKPTEKGQKRLNKKRRTTGIEFQEDKSPSGLQTSDHKTALVLLHTTAQGSFKRESTRPKIKRSKMAQDLPIVVGSHHPEPESEPPYLFSK